MSEINATIQEEIDLIVKAARGERFHFIVVAYDHLSLIDRVKAALTEKYPERKVTTLKVGAEPDAGFIQNILEAPAGLVFIDDFELLLKNEALALGFNQKRDLITKLAIALVCFVPFDRKLLQECPRKIPDMWSVRSLLAELRGYDFPQKRSFLIDNFRNTSHLAYTLQEKEDEIISLMKRIGLVSENDDSLGLLGQLHYKLGELLNSIGRIDEAIVAVKQALIIFRQIEDHRGLNLATNLLGEIEYVRGRYAESITYFKENLEIQRHAGDNNGEEMALNNLATIAYIGRDYKTALRYWKQVLSIRKHSGNVNGEVAALNNLSNIYAAEGDFDKALDFSQQSLAIEQQFSDRFGEGRARNQIGMIYYYKGDYDVALHILEQSLMIQKEIGDHHGEGNTLSGMSNIYQAIGNFDMALQYLKNSIAIQQKIGDRSGSSVNLHNMATLYLNQKNDLEKYLELEALAYKTAQEIGNANAIYQIGLYYGGVLCHSGIVERGLLILQNTYKLGLQAGFPDVENVGSLIKKYSTEVNLPQTPAE